MEENKNTIEMLIFVSDSTNCSEWVKLDLMKPTQAKSKYDEFKKEHDGHKFLISCTAMAHYLKLEDCTSIEWLLDWAEEYLQNWNEEQIIAFSDLITAFDWDVASDKVKYYDYRLIKTSDWDSDEEAVGRYYAEYLAIPEYIKPYFDYERYGRKTLQKFASVTTDDYVIIVY